MKLPAELRYTKSHEWVRPGDGGPVDVGITDHAQDLLGDIVFLELPEVGRRVEAGEECAVVESVKAASDIYAPVAGEIVAVNADALEHPESVNQDAYAAWLFRIRPDEPGSLAALLDAPAYRAQVESEEK
jgi:glycine cleavage system H protein